MPPKIYLLQAVQSPVILLLRDVRRLFGLVGKVSPQRSDHELALLSAVVGMEKPSLGKLRFLFLHFRPRADAGAPGPATVVPSASCSQASHATTPEAEYFVRLRQRVGCAGSNPIANAVRRLHSVGDRSSRGVIDHDRVGKARPVKGGLRQRLGSEDSPYPHYFTHPV